MFQISVPVFVAAILTFIGSVCFGGRVLHPDSCRACYVLNRVVGGGGGAGGGLGTQKELRNNCCSCICETYMFL